MKYLIKYKLHFLMWFMVIALAISCEKDETVDFQGEIAGASYHEVLFTRISADLVRAEVYIRVGVTFQGADGYTNLGLYKILLDQSGQELGRAIALNNITPDTYTRLTIESGDELFSGLSISQHQMQEGYTFRFTTFGSKSEGGEEMLDDVYEFTPDYNLLEFKMNYNSATVGHIDYVRVSETKVDANVNINLIFTVETEDEEELSNIGLIKYLYDENGTEVDSAIALQNIPANTEISFIIPDGATLFEGIDFDQNNLESAYTFKFKAFAETPQMEVVVMDDLFETTASYSVQILPTLETGIWIATNNNSGFSKEVELILDEANQVYYFTDFGLDWSNWNDFWYGTNFTLKSPDSEGDPVFVNLAGWGTDTSVVLEMVGDDGVTIESRSLRLMPYIYKADSPVGYYDEDTGNLIFEGVNLTDAWWDADSHDNIRMTFMKKT